MRDTEPLPERAARATRIAIVGAGKIARDAHISAIAASPDFTLVAALDPVATLDGVPSYRSFGEMLVAEPGLEAVALCCPPQYRTDLAVAALEAGLAVLLEKPPAATMEEARSLLRRARGRPGSVLVAAWHSRFAAMVPAAREALASERVISGAVSWKEDFRRWHPDQPWLWRPGGFGVLDPGINALSILTEIAPGPVTVRTSEFDVVTHREAPVAARIGLDLAGAGIALDLDFRHRGAEEWTIALETASSRRLVLSDGGACLSLDGIAVEPSALTPPEYEGVYARFASAIHRQAIDVDLEPLRIALDAIACARCRPDESAHAIV